MDAFSIQTKLERHLKMKFTSGHLNSRRAYKTPNNRIQIAGTVTI